MSNKTGNFVRQAAVLAAAGLIVRLIGFLYRLPLTSMIGNSGNGIYGASYIIYTFFLILSSAGLPAAISKMVSNRFAKKQYANAHAVFRVSLIIAACLGLLGSLALGFFATPLANLVESPRSVDAIIMLSPTVLIVSIMAVFRGYFQGMNNTVPTALSQIVEQVFNAFFSVFLCYTFMQQTGDVARGAAGGTAGTGIGALCGLLTIMCIYFVSMPKINKSLTDGDNSVVEKKITIATELVKTAVPIIVGTAIFSMTNFIDMKMVNGLLLQSGYNREEVDSLFGLLTGKYVTLTTLPVSISTALATAAVPNIARSIAKGDSENVNRKINMALRLTMLISVPAAVGIGVLGDPILMLLFPKFPEGGYLLQLGAVSIIFLALAQIVTGMLQGAGHVSVPAIAAFCGAMVKIPLNYLLIPIREVTFFGFTIPINVGGAVISTIACYAVAAGIDVFVLSKIMKKGNSQTVGKGKQLDLKNGFGKPVLASISMGLFCFFFYKVCFGILNPNLSISTSNAIACLLTIVLGVVVYFVSLYIIKGVSKEDLKYLPLKRFKS